MSNHSFNRVIDKLDDMEFPYLYVYDPEDILDDILTSQSNVTECPIIDVSSDIYTFSYNFEENKWIHLNPRTKKNEVTDDKVIKSEILNFWKKDIENWRNLCRNDDEVFSSKIDENLFFDYINKLYKEVERIRV